MEACFVEGTVAPPRAESSAIHHPRKPVLDSFEPAWPLRRFLWCQPRQAVLPRRLMTGPGVRGAYRLKPI